ncbi:MAG: glycosyltransferase family 4 protein [Gammaproteobacteria bacterium]|nr:glycosyltransferase family 4 protein [Gammaproteobacteria bacterium]
MSSYRLAFAVSMYFDYGGMQRSMLRIAHECARRGHDVHIFTGSWTGDKPEYVTVHELDTRAFTNTGKNDVLAAKLKQAVAAEHFDCVAGFTKIPGLDVYYAGDPCYAARVNEDKRWWYKLLPRYRAFIRQEAAVFNPSGNTEFMLIAHQEKKKFIDYYKARPERFHLLPPGINRNKLLLELISHDAREELRDHLGIAANDNMILLVGSRFRTKGVDRALHAFASLATAQREKSKLVIVGGDRQAPYAKLARKLGIEHRVVFTGARDDMALFYASADLLLHPPYSENTGTILIEAMLFGLPVLATDNCGFAFHVRNANAGLICPYPFQQQNLNRLLAEMLTSKKLPQWRNGGRTYCDITDLYSLIERAADVIVDRARRNAQSRRGGAV